MTDIQSKVLNLVDEIKEICKKENLRYIVHGKNAAYISSHKKFGDEQAFFSIMMPFEDIFKLKTYVEKNLSDKREIESWENNPHLQMMKFRYVDKNTLLINGSSNERHICNGIFISIIPTRSKKPSADVVGSEIYLILENFKDEKAAGKLIYSKMLSRLLRNDKYKKQAFEKVHIVGSDSLQLGRAKRKKMSKSDFAGFIIDGYKNASEPYKTSKDNFGLRTENEKCLAYMSNSALVYTLPLDLYDNVKEVEFEGRKYKVYADLELYLSCIFGYEWKAKSQEEIFGTDNASIIYDTEIPYAEFMEYTKDDETSLFDIADSKLEYDKWMKYVHDPAVESTLHTFNMARRSVDRIDIWYKLKNKRGELKKAYEAKDINKLKKLMKLYLDATERYRADEIGFYIDHELFKYARLIWDNGNYPAKVDEQGNLLSYPEYVYSLVPDIYKTETPEDYFIKRGKEFK